MTMSFRHIFFLLFASILLSCAGKVKKNASEKSDVQGAVILPDSVELYNPFLGDSLANPFITNSGYKVYTLIDASCTSCMAKLQKWSVFEASIKDKGSVSLIPICYTKDNFDILKFYFEKDSTSRLQVPLVLDLKNEFVKHNAPLISQSGEMTVLTDARNIILLRGDPIGNQQDKEEFIKRIASVH